LRNPGDGSEKDSPKASPRSPMRAESGGQSGIGRPFTDVHQLASVPGMRSDWVNAAVPLTTVFGNATVNPLTAPPDVLAAMPGMSEISMRTILDARRFSTDSTRILQSIGPAQNNFKVRPRGAISVSLLARLKDGYTAGADAVFVILPGDREPYRVLAWTPSITSVTPQESQAGAIHAH
jgi:general secretion pathway protein K